MADKKSPLEVRPTVKLIFDGLFFFGFDSTTEESGMCHAGVLTTGLNHELTVRIIETVAEGTKAKPVYRHSKKVFTLCQATCRLLGDIYLRVQPRSGEVQPVRRYGYGNGAPLADRSDPTAEPGNFKWIIDFENGEFGDEKLDIAPGVFSPVLHINTGTFYTQLVPKESYDIIRADESRRDFGHVAQTISANLELEPEDEITLEDSGGNSLWKLDRNRNATYLIHFLNVCPSLRAEMPLEHDLTHAQMMANASTAAQFGELADKLAAFAAKTAEKERSDKPGDVPEHRSDFHYYYDAFRNCSGLEHHDFKSKSETGAFPSVCYPTTGSKQLSLPSK